MICDNIKIGENGHLYFAGFDTVELAEKYGTPLYLIDEDKLRENCRTYDNAFKKHFGSDAKALYARLLKNRDADSVQVDADDGLSVSYTVNGVRETLKIN